MRALYALTVVGVLGVLALTVTISALGPDAPRAAVAVYNLWLLATVTIVVVAGILLCIRFFSFITGGSRGQR